MPSSDKPLGGRVAIVSTGARASMFVRGIAARPHSQVVAICEPNAVRAQYYNNLLKELGAPEVPIYKPDGFQDMLKSERVETVVVTCIDALHDLYIVPALEAGRESLLVVGHAKILTYTLGSSCIDRKAYDHEYCQVPKDP